jgi:hypothetical protein
MINSWLSRLDPFRLFITYEWLNILSPNSPIYLLPLLLRLVIFILTRAQRIKVIQHGGARQAKYTTTNWQSSLVGVPGSVQSS